MYHLLTPYKNTLEYIPSILSSNELKRKSEIWAKQRFIIRIFKLHKINIRRSHLEESVLSSLDIFFIFGGYELCLTDIPVYPCGLSSLHFQNLVFWPLSLWETALASLNSATTLALSCVSGAARNLYALKIYTEILKINIFCNFN